MGRKEAAEVQRVAAREALKKMGVTPGMGALDEALAALESRGPRPRPYSARVESAANAETGEVIRLYGEELGSASEAVRDLLARGAASLAAERSVTA